MVAASTSEAPPPTLDIGAVHDGVDEVAAGTTPTFTAVGGGLDQAAAAVAG